MRTQPETPAVSRQRLRLSGGGELSYLSAGDRDLPALLLLHGFPSSARMFQQAIPALARDAHVIAPDLPGFGESDVPPEVTFAALACAIAELLDYLHTGQRVIYLHDFGAPVGFDIAMRAPDLVSGLIIQNANAHRTGLGPAWQPTQAFWAQPSPTHEAAATAHLTPEGTRDQYVSGVPPEIAARISPERWEDDWRVMTLPGRLDAQRALVKDYGRYVATFDAIASFLSRRQPPALLLWGRHDVFFDLAEVLSWMQVLPRMEAHVFDAGHLLLETHSHAATPLMRDFLRKLTRQRAGV